MPEPASTAFRRWPMRSGCRSMSASSEIDAVKASGPGHEGLAHTLADAGLLPMYGMPTRVRNLYLGSRSRPGAPGSWIWSAVDRDLDIAIFEFAPGAVLTKDKQEHLCVGVTGALRD